MLQIGSRVKPNPLHPHYKLFNQQHKINNEDCEGTIVGQVSSGTYNWTVDWDNKRKQLNYQKDYLIEIESEESEVQYMPPELREGMRVIANPSSEHYKTFQNQSKYDDGTDCPGIITSYKQGQSGTHWIKVKWDNGREDGYPVTYVMPYTTVARHVPQPASTPDELSKGMRVCYHDGTQSAKIKGTIQTKVNATHFRVAWDDGVTTTHSYNILIPITTSAESEDEALAGWDFERVQNDPAKHKQAQPVHVPTPMPELPLLPGQRVCLNPDTSEYKDYRYKADDCDVGYVKKINHPLDTIIGWRGISSSQKNVQYTIVFDSGKTFTVYHKNLLLIDGNTRTVTMYKINSDVYYCMEGNKADQEHIDERIIYSGYRPSTKEVYDDAWRANFMETVKKK